MSHLYYALGQLDSTLSEQDRLQPRLAVEKHTLYIRMQQVQQACFPRSEKTGAKNPAKVVIVIDAADESSSLESSNPIHHYLPVGDEHEPLPDNFRIIISSRTREILAPLHEHAEINLRRDGGSKLVRDYWIKRCRALVARPRHRSVLLGLTRVVVKKADGVVLYAKELFNDLDRQEDLEGVDPADLPEGLRGLYRRRWKKPTTKEPEPGWIPNIHRTLRILALLLKPLPEDAVRRIAELDTTDWGYIREDLSRFLSQAFLEKGRWALSHSSLVEFILSEDITSKDRLLKLQNRISDVLEETSSESTRMRDYSLRHAAHHQYAARRFETILATVTESYVEDFRASFGFLDSDFWSSLEYAVAASIVRKSPLHLHRLIQIRRKCYPS